MPSGSLSKVDLLPRIYKLKNQVHDRRGKYHNYDDMQRHIVDQTLNDILDILGEYSQ